MSVLKPDFKRKTLSNVVNLFPAKICKLFSSYFSKPKEEITKNCQIIHFSAKKGPKDANKG